MWELTPKISWTITSPPRGLPVGLARYAESLWPSSAVSATIWPIVLLLSLLRLERPAVHRGRPLTGDRGPMHHATVRGFVPGASQMQDSTIVPHHEIVDVPRVAIDELGLGRELQQRPQELPPLLHRPADDVRRVGAQKRATGAASPDASGPAPAGRAGAPPPPPR